MAEGGENNNSGVADVRPTSMSPGISGSATLAEGENVNLKFTKSNVNVVAGDQINVNKFVYNITGTKGKTLPGIQKRGAELNSGIIGTPAPSQSGVKRSATLAEGEHVEQKFVKSSLNIVAGDQTIQFHTNVYGEPSTVNQGARCEKLVKICNDHTKDMTEKSILDDFRNEELVEPCFEVHPQMRNVSVNKYYKGHHSVETTGVDESLAKVRQQQLRKEVGFHRPDTIRAKSIKIDGLIKSICSSKKITSKAVGVTAIVASAGSGKTTLMRRIARQLLHIHSSVEVTNAPFCRPRMILYIELKDIPEKSSTTPVEFLFGGLYKNKSEAIQVFEWLDEHQSDAVIIFDGLDQARWDFDEKSLRQMKKYEVASTSNIMFNILTRNILRQVKILIASREFKVSELPAMARPETIITLNGLTLEDAHKLFAYLLGENGEDLWEKIGTMSPRLLNLVSVPVFLILTAVVMGRDPSKPPPATVTGLYNRIILALESVENIRNRAQILAIIQKLKALAFQGMIDGRVVFKETDLSQFQLSADEVQDLMTKVPGNNLLSRHLMQGEFDFFFCHQSIQEFLAASFVTEMDVDVFSRFDKEHLHEDRWSVVRRFVAGVVFSEAPRDLHRVSEQARKQHVLAKSLRSHLENKTGAANKYSRMELYTATYESNNDNMRKHLCKIDASNISLSRDEAHIVGTLAASNPSLGSLNLSKCRIDDELLQIITRCLEDRIHVKNVSLHGNNFSAPALRYLLGYGQTESYSGYLDWNDLKLTVEGSVFIFTKEEDAINISGEVGGKRDVKVILF